MNEQDKEVWEAILACTDEIPSHDREYRIATRSARRAVELRQRIPDAGVLDVVVYGDNEEKALAFTFTTEGDFDREELFSEWARCESLERLQ